MERSKSVDSILEDYSFEGYLLNLEKNAPKKWVWENMDMFYIHYNIFRKRVRNNREHILKFLYENNILETHKECMDAYSKFKKYESSLANFGNKANIMIDRALEYLNPIVPKEKVGNYIMVITEDVDSDSYKVIDISRGKENVLALIFKKGGISWLNKPMNTMEMAWIVEHAKLLDKGIKKGVIV